MFVSKGKINTSNFFPMLHPGKSQEKPQYNMAISPFLGKAPHFALPLPFSRNIFQTSPPPPPHFHQFWKGPTPLPPSFMKEGIRTMYVACYQQSKTSSLFPWSLGQYNHVKKRKKIKKCSSFVPLQKRCLLSLIWFIHLFMMFKSFRSFSFSNNCFLIFLFFLQVRQI